MSFKITGPKFGIGSEGISIGFQVGWSHDNHRQREQRARRYESRVRHGKILPKGAMAAAPAEELPYDYDYTPRPARVYKFPSRDPNKYEGSTWEKGVRGANADSPVILRSINKSLWSIWAIIMRGLFAGAWEADRDTEHRWDIPDPRKWKNLPGPRAGSGTYYPKE